jgi:methyl-CpG-binding domain protein 4
MVLPQVPALTPKKLSPYMLIQEFLRDEPWRLLVACIMLNQTSAKQVHGVVNQFFERWPDEETFLRALDSDVKKMIKPLGFQNVRYNRLVMMTMDWYRGKRPPEKIRGVGKYATDSFKIFCSGYLVQDVLDKELKNYVQWAKEEGSSRVGS